MSTTPKDSDTSFHRRQELFVAIPASFVSDVPHPRERTLRVGLIGRAAAIFRVGEIIVFPDSAGTDQRREMKLITTILSYMETPQYLRKRLFEIQPELEYAGVLPPLRTPHHPLGGRVEMLEVGEYREGVVLSSSEEGTLIDAGVERPILIQGKTLRQHSRVTVKIAETGKMPKAVLVDREKIAAYWGYRVIASTKSFGQIAQTGKFDLIIATSRRGKPISSVLNKLKKRLGNSRKILVAFGAPQQGLYEIVAEEKLNLEQLADFIVNTIPDQGTETVRTEEALYASLAILNTLDA